MAGEEARKPGMAYAEYVWISQNHWRPQLIPPVRTETSGLKMATAWSTYILWVPLSEAQAYASDFLTLKH